MYRQEFSGAASDRATQCVTNFASPAEAEKLDGTSSGCRSRCGEKPLSVLLFAAPFEAVDESLLGSPMCHASKSKLNRFVFRVDGDRTRDEDATASSHAASYSKMKVAGKRWRRVE
jgi:hypothetical protein